MAWFHLHRHLHDAFIPHPGNDYNPHAVRRTALRWYAGALIGVKLVTLGIAGLSFQSARVSDVTAYNITKLTNNARRDQKIAILRSNAALTKAAQSKANDMLRQQYFAHVSPTNISPWYWFKQAGYSYQYAGENLALDFIQSEDVIQAWLNSPSHRKNLLNTKYKEVGVAVLSGQFKGNQSIIVVQMFGTPTPPKTTRVAQAPTQTPTPTVAREQLAQAIVLGEEEETPTPTPTPTPEPSIPIPVPPAVPTIQTPSAGSVVTVARPEIIGSAEANSLIDLKVDAQAAGSAQTDSNGIYSLTPVVDLTDGSHALEITSTARGLSTPSSGSLLITVDTAPPQIDTAQSFALLSLRKPDTFVVRVASSSDVSQITCSCGQAATQLHQEPGGFIGELTMDSATASSGLLSLNAKDGAGNEVSLALADTKLFSTGTVAASTGPLAVGLKAISYSRTIFGAFVVIMLLVLILNVLIRLEHQHHPSLVGALLILYLAGTLWLL